MRTGYEKGYNVITLKDCTATVSEEEQRLAVEKNYPMFSRPMNHDEFLTELSRAAATDTPTRRASQPTQAVRARPAGPARSSDGGEVRI